MTRILDHVGGTIPDDFPLAVAMGRVHGWRTWRKFGMNDTVTSGTEYMWPVGALRVLPTTATVVTAVSTSVQDLAAGTGVVGLYVEGLDANYDEVSDNLVLNGTSSVTGTVEMLRVNRAYTTTPGSTSTTLRNAGNLTITVNAQTQAYIQALDGQTHQVLYTVPRYHYVLITSYIVETGRMAGSSDLEILGEILLTGSNTWRVISARYVYQQSMSGSQNNATLIPAKAELQQRIVSNVSTQASSVVSGYIVDARKFPLGTSL